MTPAELRDLCQLYALGILDGEEKEQMERLLAENSEEVQRAMRDAVRANAAIAAMTPQAEPSRRLKKRLMASVGSERAGRGWLGALAAACAALAIAAVWFGSEQQRVSGELAASQSALREARDTLRRSQLDVARMQAAFRFLDQPETRLVGFGKGEPAPPRGNVFVNPHAGVLLIASNLPKLEAGKTYQMWVIPKGGKPVPAGLFQPDSQGSAVHLLANAVDVRSTGAVAVSVEPESGSAQPTTTPIIVAALAGL